MHFFTSINNNYMAKARVLAATVKKKCRGAKFSLVLADKIPESFVLENEDFDEVITLDDLGIPVPNVNVWAFIHTVVELCTAVKGQALVKFLEEGSEKVVYLDPDIAVFDDLKMLDDLLNSYDFLLTPHQTVQEATKQHIMDNEICSLKHGIYNFGFFAASNRNNGLKIARWWRDRLVDFCFDDIPNGLFTDQRWGDLIPALFENYFIIKDPGCNVSTWNLTTREVHKKGTDFYVNDSKLKFYHFSGFDSGAQELMLKINGKNNPCLLELRAWYIEQCDANGQQTMKEIPSIYNFYDNGEKITLEQRHLLKKRLDVQAYFAETSPYIVEQERSYLKWFNAEYAQAFARRSSYTNEQIEKIEEELNQIYTSRAWKLICKYRSFKSKLIARR